VTDLEAPCVLGRDCLGRGYFKDPKGYKWAFGIAALETEDIKQVSTLPSLSEDPSIMVLLRVEANRGGAAARERRSSLRGSSRRQGERGRRLAGYSRPFWQLK